MGKKSFSWATAFEYLKAVIYLGTLTIGGYKVLAGLDAGIYRHVYIPPVHFAPAEFLPKVGELMGRFVSADDSVVANFPILDSLKDTSAKYLADSSATMAIWTLCAEEGFLTDSFDITMEFKHKDILDWKFLPEENFVQTPEDAQSARETDQLRFGVRHLVADQPIGVVVVQRNAIACPEKVTFRPELEGALDILTPLPFSRIRVWYVFFFVIGIGTMIILRVYVERLKLWVINFIRTSGARPTR